MLPVQSRIIFTFGSSIRCSCAPLTDCISVITGGVACSTPFHNITCQHVRLFPSVLISSILSQGVIYFDFTGFLHIATLPPFVPFDPVPLNAFSELLRGLLPQNYATSAMQNLSLGEGKASNANGLEEKKSVDDVIVKLEPGTELRHFAPISFDGELV